MDDKYSPVFKTKYTRRFDAQVRLNNRAIVKMSSTAKDKRDFKARIKKSHPQCQILNVTEVL